MLKAAMKILLAVALVATPIAFFPQVAHAQSGDEQRAYQAGYNNGVNDRNKGKPLNLKTGNWHGDNLRAYERGYEDGYNRRRQDWHGGPGHDYDHGQYNQAAPSYGQNDAQRRAYQAGFNNGANDRSKGKPLNLTTGNWHGENLDYYRRGYEDGYRGRGQGHDHHDHYR